MTSDFIVDDESGQPRVKDQSKVTIGGLITAKTVKSTKQRRLMAFLTVEDLVGTTEVLVFPNDYEKNQNRLSEDRKIFVRGRVSASEDQQAKLIAEQIIPFEDVPAELWLQFPVMEDYKEQRTQLLELFGRYPGKDRVILYIRKDRVYKKLPASVNVDAGEELLSQLRTLLGTENVKIR